MGFPEQQQRVPGVQARMNPRPDCGEDSYRGSGKLAGKAAVITGADSGIGRAVAIAFAREGAVPHMPPGSSIIGSSSVNSDMPSPTLAPYAATKAAIANLSASLAQMLGPKGIRVNSVAPGPIWTPLIPSTMPPEKVAHFGADTPLGRAGQPAELAPTYVLLAADDGSYISGARVAVTGGRPIL
ncbi:SDR family oxidoreductase [Nocardia vaccinii]|uniref:SDR family oxidoreductase n=1 Tax=Nocardia vaccinii TaxID=1822 RepID=UPI000836D672|nr:SDR family oxidoreductase [Nocardia vaccinii]